MDHPVDIGGSSGSVGLRTDAERLPPAGGSFGVAERMTHPRFVGYGAVRMKG